MINTAYAKKEDRLKEAAKEFLRVGDFKQFCEIQFELRNFKKALAFAPAVSIEYWQELAERHASLLEKEGNQEAPVAAIIANRCNNAVSLFQSREDFEDGKVVKALQLTGVFKSVLEKIKSKDSSQLTPVNSV